MFGSVWLGRGVGGGEEEAPEGMWKAVLFCFWGLSGTLSWEWGEKKQVSPELNSGVFLVRREWDGRREEGGKMTREAASG